MKKFTHCNLPSTLSSINIIHPWTHDILFFHVTKYYVLGVKEYFSNILSKLEEFFKKKLILFPCSRSCLQAHEITSLSHKTSHARMGLIEEQHTTHSKVLKPALVRLASSNLFNLLGILSWGVASIPLMWWPRWRRTMIL
jgi:hypothetical protein